MGWSCSLVADEVMEKITASCLKQTKTQNLFKRNGLTYMYEISRREHMDGSITGHILVEVAEGLAKKVCNFRIDGVTGQVRPVWFGKLAK